MRKLTLISAAISFFCFSYPGFCDLNATEQWKGLIQDGHNLTIGEHPNQLEAVRYFSKAVALARENKLPEKYYAEALCRMTTAGIASGVVPIVLADQHCQEIRELYKSEKAKHALDPDLGGYILDLADKYAQHNKSDVKDCYEHAYALSMDVLSETFPESKDLARSTYILSDYYVQDNKPDKAIEVLLQFKLKCEKKLKSKMLMRSIYELYDRLAVSYEAAHRYESAKKAESMAMNAAKFDVRYSNIVFPRSYSFLAMNALAQKQSKENNEYFSKAIVEARKVRGNTDAIEYVNQLFELPKIDKHDQQLELAEAELKIILEVEEALSADKKKTDFITYLLLETLKDEHKTEEWKRLAESGVFNDQMAIKHDSIKNAIGNQWLAKMKLANSLQSSSPRAKLDKKQSQILGDDPHPPDSKAQSVYLEALNLAEKFGPESREVQTTLLKLEISYFLDHKFAAVEPYYHRTITMTHKYYTYEARKKLAPESFPLMDELANYYEQEATAHYEWCLGFWNHCLDLRAAVSPEHKKLLNTYLAAGNEALRRGRYDLAEEPLKGAVITIENRANGRNSPDLIIPLKLLAKAQEGNKNYKEAIFSLNRALILGRNANLISTQIKIIKTDIARVTAKFKMGH
ncbi:MAG: hypothetical protein P4L53_07695 [Candidatus Obscuribacterales bacterium]|nr:hypothetical protein [Candidatus Obscuribacterales bacterium]